MTSLPKRAARGGLVKKHFFIEVLCTVRRLGGGMVCEKYIELCRRTLTGSPSMEESMNTLGGGGRRSIPKMHV